MSGRSMTKACFKAASAVSFSSSPWGFTRRCGPGSVAAISGAGCIFIAWLSISISLHPRSHQVSLKVAQSSAPEGDRTKVLRHRAQDGHRQEEQGADDKNRAEQEDAEGEAVIPQGSQAK